MLIGMRLDVESLRTLRAVARLGSFTEAARQLGMSQSAVSWKMKRLEERVGLELVDRRDGEMTLTPHGTDLLRYAERILTAHDEAVEHLSRSDLEGVIRLGTNEDHGGLQLADVLARFGRMYPQVELKVRVGLSGDVAEWLERGEVDLAILQLPVDDVSPDDDVLWTDQLHWIQGRGHDLPSAETVPVVSFGPGFSCLDHSERSLTSAGIDHRVVLESPMLSGVQRAVEAGLGIAPLHRRNLTNDMVVWVGDDRCPLPPVSEVIRGRAATGQPTLGDEILDAIRSMLLDSLSGPESAPAPESLRVIA